MKIIFLSNQLFDFPLWTNKKHVSTRMAKLGHEVLFVDPPIRLRKLLKEVFSGRWSLPRLVRGGYHSPEFDLQVFTPLTRSFSEAPDLVDFNLRRLQKQVPDFFDGQSILWVYNPAMIAYVAKIPHRLLVYDCVDDYPSMANYQRLGLAEKIARQEEEIARRAGVVFATTEELAVKLAQYSSQVHYVGNAGDYERFSPIGEARLSASGQRSRSLQVAPELQGLPRPVIGFTGAIDEYKLDLPLLVKVARANPNYSLVVVGPQGVADNEPNLSELKSLANVHLIPEQPYERMPEFFAGFDAYIIPYHLNDYTLKGCFPVKFLDALAAGLPTIVTNLPSYRSFAEVCYIAKSADDFFGLVATALAEDNEDRIAARLAVAKENSWDGKVAKMLSMIGDRLASQPVTPSTAGPLVGPAR